MVPIGIMFQRAGIQNLTALALHRHTCGSVFWRPVPRRGSSARYNPCPLHSPEPSPLARMPAVGQPWTPLCMEGLPQLPGPDTHWHKRQIQLQPCFTFTSGTNNFPPSCLHHSLATLGKQCRIFCNSTVSKPNKHCTSDWKCLKLEQPRSLLYPTTAFI